VTETERPSYPRPILRVWLGWAVVLLGAVWLYGLAWNRPPLPDLAIIGAGTLASACALFLRALTPSGTARRRLLTLDAARQERLRAINRRSYAPLAMFALSFGLLGLGSGFKGFLPSLWYAIVVICAAATLVGSGAYMYTLRVAERRLYAEQA
jgi:hypothetical protein